jgi:hypothetical protein
MRFTPPCARQCTRISDTFWSSHLEISVSKAGKSPARLRRLHRQHNFFGVQTVFHTLVSFTGVCEREYAVNDRAQPVIAEAG